LWCVEYVWVGVGRIQTDNNRTKKNQFSKLCVESCLFATCLHACLYVGLSGASPDRAAAAAAAAAAAGAAEGPASSTHHENPSDPADSAFPPGLSESEQTVAFFFIFLLVSVCISILFSFFFSSLFISCSTVT
jgi:hypothetical protein